MSSEDTNENSVTSEVNQEQNLGNYEEDITKYTKIDNLDEDSVVESGKFFLVSFISPEGIMNCTTRGLKIRTHKNKVCYSTLEEAKTAADEINKKDKYFHVFVGETGKWMGWDPAPDDRTKVEQEKWADADQDAIMQKMREKEEKQLNELNALVGKKKDIVNKEKVTHKKRVATAIKDSAKGEETQTESQTESQSGPEVMTEEEVKKEMEKRNKKTHNPSSIRDKLRKKLQEKQSDPLKENKINTSDILKERLTETTTTQTKLDENLKKLNELLNKAKTA